jgi:hypothetical protein
MHAVAPERIISSFILCALVKLPPHIVSVKVLFEKNCNKTFNTFVYNSLVCIKNIFKGRVFLGLQYNVWLGCQYNNMR